MLEDVKYVGNNQSLFVATSLLASSNNCTINFVGSELLKFAVHVCIWLLPLTDIPVILSLPVGESLLTIVAACRGELGLTKSQMEMMTRELISAKT